MPIESSRRTEGVHQLLDSGLLNRTGRHQESTGPPRLKEALKPEWSPPTTSLSQICSFGHQGKEVRDDQKLPRELRELESLHFQHMFLRTSTISNLPLRKSEMAKRP